MDRKVAVPYSQSVPGVYSGSRQNGACETVILRRELARFPYNWAYGMPDWYLYDSAII